jgi:hypothetical protein
MRGPYIYVYIYVYIHIYTYRNTYIYLRIYIYIHIYIKVRYEGKAKRGSLFGLTPDGGLGGEGMENHFGSLYMIILQ